MAGEKEKAVVPEEGDITLRAQPTARPTRKTMAGAIGGIGAGLPVAWLIVDTMTMLGVQNVPPRFEMALGAILTGLFGFIAAYITRNRASEV